MNSAATEEPVYQQLITLARSRRTITYRALAAPVGLDLDQPSDRDDLSGILRSISTREHWEGRPMLTAVVGLAARKRPGRGFFALAGELGALISADQGTSFRRELACVYAFWGG